MTTCAQCPISLVCHAGRLYDFLLCPQCGQFQVELIMHEAYQETFYFEGEPNKPQKLWMLEERKKLLIKCDERYLDEDQHIAFMQECDEEHYRTHGREAVNYLASILIPDPGPKQVAPRRGTRNMLLVKFCNDCYAKMLEKDLP